MGISSSVEPRRQPLTHTALKWSLAGVVALLLSLGTNLFRPTLHGVGVASGIVDQSAQYREKIRENEALERELAFLRTEPGQEWALHKKGLVRPGEQLGSLQVDPSPPPPAGSRAERVRKWLEQTQVNGSRRLHHTGEVVSCYVGLRPLDMPPVPRNPKPARLSKPETAPQKQPAVEPGEAEEKPPAPAGQAD